MARAIVVSGRDRLRMYLQNKAQAGQESTAPPMPSSISGIGPQELIGHPRSDYFANLVLKDGLYDFLCILFPF